jgi:hypothetical protein
MLGRRSGQLLSYGGRVLVHNDKAELEFLFPTARVIRITDGDLDQPTMSIREHPSMASVSWPLRREDFVDMHTRGG